MVVRCRDEGGELEAEALHVQPPVLLNILPLHLITSSPSVAARHSYALLLLPPALHLC